MKKLLLSLFLIFFVVFLSKEVFSEELVERVVGLVNLGSSYESQLLEYSLMANMGNSENVVLRLLFKRKEDLPKDIREIMFLEKVSGLVVIDNSNVVIFSTKGQITNMNYSNLGNISEVILNIIEKNFPKKEKAKVIKEIEEIDYISQLEEATPYLSFTIGFLNSLPGYRIVYYNTNNQATFLQDYNLASLFMGVSLSVSFDSRYFFGKLRFNLPANNSENFSVGSILGLWFFRGFMMFGVDVNGFRTFVSGELEVVSYQNDQQKITNISIAQTTTFWRLAVQPVVAVKFTKDVIITVNPIFTGVSFLLLPPEYNSETYNSESGGPPICTLISAHVKLNNNLGIEFLANISGNSSLIGGSRKIKVNAIPGVWIVPETLYFSSFSLNYRM